MCIDGDVVLVVSKIRSLVMNEEEVSQLILFGLCRDSFELYLFKIVCEFKVNIWEGDLFLMFLVYIGFS